CTCADGIPETCDLPCTNVIVQLQDGTVYDSLFCPACDLETGVAAEYQTILNGTTGGWRASYIDILTAADGLQAGWNTVVIEARDWQPDGTVGRTVRTTREFYVDVPIP
ncbi:MAG: hypothetical protein JW952_07745, partial [Candidatus Eisenbacteria bacterium]|nr:hypothetical protein [Candidatus Eisenbacteria bacterium]